MEYVADNRRLMSEWDTLKNIRLGLDPGTLLVGSGKKAWWRCEKGHEWQTEIYSRKNGRKCPVCTNRVIVEGFNDLTTINPSAAKEWNYEKNGDLRPENVGAGSKKKVWWKCSTCGHEWQTEIYVRQNHGCPKCSFKRIGSINSTARDGSRLTDIFPDAVLCWDYEKNHGLRPENMAAKSNKKVWWKCSECGKSWEAAAYTRIKFCRTTCKSCSLKLSNRTYIRQGINDLATKKPQIAKEWDYEKNEGLKPEDIGVASREKVWWKCEKGHEWQASVRSRTRSDSSCPFCSNQSKRLIAGFNDLATRSPALAKEWNYEKNGDLRPEDVSYGSPKAYWWKCEKGHEWQASCNNRERSQGCPFCLGNRVLLGFNDLVTTHPELADEWDYEKNGDLRPEDITAHSGRRVWWKCSTCGHEWQASTNNRARGHSCPACVNRVVIAGVNDLATTHPNLAKEWNYEKNGDLRPEDIIAGSPKKVWWKCEKGHEWQAVVVSRKKNANCPICAAHRNTSLSEKAVGYYLLKYGIAIEENKKIDRRELDIFIPSLNIAIEYDGGHYHTSKSRDLAKNKRCRELGIKLIRLREPGLPTLHSTSIDISVGDTRNSYVHLNEPIKEVLRIVMGPGEYDVDLERDYGEIYKRYQKGTVKKSLADMYSELLKEWDYEKNTVDPKIIPASSHYKAWWKCSTCGHEWQTPVYSRAQGGTGCQLCGYKRMGKMNARLKDASLSLAAKCPVIAKEWNYEKNDDLRPEDVSAKSNMKVWWRCSFCGKEWQASICNRTRARKMPSGCRDCKRKKLA